MTTPYHPVSVFWPSAPVLEWTELPDGDLSTGLIDCVDVLPAIHPLDQAGSSVPTLEVFEGLRSTAQWCLSWSATIGGVDWTDLPDVSLEIRQGEQLVNAIHDSYIFPLVLEPAGVVYPGFSTVRRVPLTGHFKLSARRFQCAIRTNGAIPTSPPSLFVGGVYLRAF